MEMKLEAATDVLLSCDSQSRLGKSRELQVDSQTHRHPKQLDLSRISPTPSGSTLGQFRCTKKNYSMYVSALTNKPTSSS